MSAYVRALVCVDCSGICELIGENADLWECTSCGATWFSTEDDVRRYRMAPEPGECGDE